MKTYQSSLLFMYYSYNGVISLFRLLINTGLQDDADAVRQ